MFKLTQEFLVINLFANVQASVMLPKFQFSDPKKMRFRPLCSSPPTAGSAQDKCQLSLMVTCKRKKEASSGWSLFWVAVSQLTAGAEQIDWSPSALPVQEHATISIYSKRQISDLFYLYSCYAFSSWHLRSFSSPPPRLSSTCSEIPRTRHGFSKSHGAVWPLGSNMFRDLCSHRCILYWKVYSFLVLSCLFHLSVVIFTLTYNPPIPETSHLSSLFSLSLSRTRSLSLSLSLFGHRSWSVSSALHHRPPLLRPVL